jgi:hypothetical protein
MDMLQAKGDQNKIKLSDPVKYEGKSIAQGRAFLHDVRDHFLANPTRYQTDIAKVMFATSHMVMSVKEQWRLHSDESGATSWEQFEQFINNYVDPEGGRGSRAAYRILTERQKNSRVREWGARCQEIWPRLEEKEFHVQMFIETLNNNLQREIARSSPKLRSR